MHTSQLSVILTLTAKPEHRDLITQHVDSKVSAIRQQKGCVQLFIFTDADNPLKLVAFQTWENQECWRAHLQSQAARELAEIVESLGASFSIEKMTFHNI